MEQQRVNCYLAGCERCTMGVYEGENFMGYDLYSCPMYKHKHFKKNARKCKNFRCKKPKRNQEMCKHCRRGEGE